MRAVVWRGRRDVRVERVPDPSLLNPRDAVVRVTAASIAGSDLPLYDGRAPGLRPGTILGHEAAGEVVEVGREVRSLAPGDRVVIPSTISCGRCAPCTRREFALCANSHPRAGAAEEAFGQAPGGHYGSSAVGGGYAGSQAEFVRVPFADVGPLRIPADLSDEQVLFLSEALPAGWQAAEQAGIEDGDVVAVWGCGPVGLFALVAARLLGARRAIGVDGVAARLAKARDAGFETVDASREDVREALRERTGGRGPDRCVDAVGSDAHVHGVLPRVDRVKQALGLEDDRPQALREAILACREGGTVSVVGAYAGSADAIPLGAAFHKGLTIRMAPAHVPRHMEPLLRRIAKGEIDPTFPITHRAGLEDAPAMYRRMRDRSEGCVKVVLRPHGPGC